MCVLMVFDVYFFWVNGVLILIEIFCCMFREFGVDVRLVVLGYGDEVVEVGVICIVGWLVLGDCEDCMVGWGVMYGVVLEVVCDCDLVYIQMFFIVYYVGLKVVCMFGLLVVVIYYMLFEEYFGYYVLFLFGGWLKGWVWVFL